MIEAEQRKRGRPRKVRPAELWAPSGDILPVKSPGPGRKKSKDALSLEAVALIVRGALDRHGLHGVLVPATLTQGSGVAILLQHGLSNVEVARSLGQTEKFVRNRASQWRQANGVTLDQWRETIAQNAKARRTGQPAIPTVGFETTKPAQPARDALTDEEVAEVLELVNTLAAGCARKELALQLKREVSWEEIERLPDEVIADLLTQADIRAANKRTAWR